jgi:formylglycine-generating enzyme required for sulfatase activity
MVCVPCGPFVMGSDPGEGDGDEMPEHVVTLSAYCIDRTEVTVTAYLACVGAGGCGSPHGPHGTDDYPVGNVTWLQAAGYCSFAGKRLPTEAEWEKAARGGCELAGDAASCDGPDERTWPWGDDAPTCDRAVFLGCGTGTARVGSVSPLGDSPYGLQDMAGNAQEWVADYYDAAWYGGCGEPCVDPTGPATSITNMRVARGGDRSGSAAAVRAANRYWFARDFADYDLGFRCAAAAP